MIWNKDACLSFFLNENLSPGLNIVLQINVKCFLFHVWKCVLSICENHLKGFQRLKKNIYENQSGITQEMEICMPHKMVFILCNQGP